MQALIAYNACMSSIQYTLRAVTKTMDKRLREKAAREGKSLNTVLLESLEHGLGMHDEKPKHHDLDAFYGSWQKDAKFDAALKDFDRVDDEVWQ
jgi:hypothetical protein